MFSQTAEYALRAAIWLAGHPNQPLTTQQIAAATQVPAGYLSKVLQSLGRAGLVNAQRGLHGGFMLGRSPSEMTILDVINAVDPLRRVDRCPVGIESHALKLCALHQRLDNALALVENSLRSSTLAELLGDSSCSRPLCDANGEHGRNRPARTPAPTAR